MHRFKIRSPAIFFMEWTKRFVGGFITFQSVLLWRYYNDKKSLPDIGGTTIQDNYFIKPSHHICNKHTLGTLMTSAAADVICSDFQRVISRYIQNISICLSSKTQRGLRTIFMQKSMPQYACLIIEIDEVWIDRFCVRYDWWRRLQPTSSVSPVWQRRKEKDNDNDDNSEIDNGNSDFIYIYQYEEKICIAPDIFLW